MNYKNSFANVQRPEVPNGILSVQLLLSDPIYHETFSQIQNNKLYTRNWNELLSSCDMVKTEALSKKNFESKKKKKILSIKKQNKKN